jgi:hypothetical protein
MLLLFLTVCFCWRRTGDWRLAADHLSALDPLAEVSRLNL